MHIVIKIVLYPNSYKNCILFLLCSPFALSFRNFEGMGTPGACVQALELQFLPAMQVRHKIDLFNDKLIKLNIIYLYIRFFLVIIK